jgi:hypothetical protein
VTLVILLELAFKQFGSSSKIEMLYGLATNRGIRFAIISQGSAHGTSAI